MHRQQERGCVVLAWQQVRQGFDVVGVVWLNAVATGWPSPAAKSYWRFLRSAFSRPGLQLKARLSAALAWLPVRLVLLAFALSIARVIPSVLAFRNRSEIGNSCASTYY